MTSNGENAKENKNEDINKTLPLIYRNNINKMKLDDEEDDIAKELNIDAYDADTLNQSIVKVAKDYFKKKSNKYIDKERDNIILKDDDDDYSSNEIVYPATEFAYCDKDNTSNSDTNSGILKKSLICVDDSDISYYNLRISKVGQLPLKIVGNTVKLHSGYELPNFLWNNLFNYQKDCIHWLWDIHMKKCGGILSDEMGLGKTIQIIVFLSGLHYSNINCGNSLFNGLGCILILCPSTLLKQWVNEFHVWWPWFRIIIFHNSNPNKLSLQKKILRTCTKIDGTIVVTTYNTLILHKQLFLNIQWDYVILDEGHKIKNPDIEITLTVKQFQTPHRIILSGTPIQNNLKELWSLIDFVCPRLLGTLPSFMENIASPIAQGGYANASKLQVMSSYKTAKVLQNIIEPYILRRTKSQVSKTLNLPPKKERILFCKLTPYQVELYKQYLNSGQVRAVLSGNASLLQGLGQLRKLCNHPHLFEDHSRNSMVNKGSSMYEELFNKSTSFFMQSGKMIVLEALLKRWKVLDHRVLLFSQSRKMLDLIEKFLCTFNYKYLRMDGTTSINQRDNIINQFNNDTEIFIFLLTTKVGGVGLNLTSANRVIIYDPDWNPSTDVQARERAWRIGQKNDVTIYRLISSGTIEEKIYQRQVFKQFLSNKVLDNASHTRNLYQFKDIHDLFTYNDTSITDTSHPQQQLYNQSTEISINKTPTVPNLIRVENKEHHNGCNNEYDNDIKKTEPSSLLKRPKLDATQVEDCLLNYLLKKNKNLYKAIEYDQVDSNKKKIDLVVFEEEANRRAKEALASLKKSVLNESNNPYYSLTWTGKHGLNYETNQSKFSYSSQSTSNNIKSRKRTHCSKKKPPSSKDLLKSLTTKNTIIESKEQLDKQAIFNDLLTFLKNFGGSVTSNQIISRYDSSVEQGLDTEVFVRVLKSMCSFTPSKPGSKSGKWSLKPEFI